MARTFASTVVYSEEKVAVLDNPAVNESLESIMTDWFDKYEKNNVSLNKDIYDLTAIKSAMANYAALAHIKVEDASDYYLCRFSHCKYDSTRTIQEFCNYVIDLMNCRSNPSDLY